MSVCFLVIGWLYGVLCFQKSYSCQYFKEIGFLFLRLADVF